MAKVRCILLVRSGAEVSQRSFELTQFPQSPLEIISLLKQQDLRLQTMAFDVSVACPAEKKLQKLANSNQVALFFAKVTTEMTFDVTLTGSGSTSASRLLTSQYLDDDLLRLHIFAPRTDSEDKGQTVDQHTEKMFVIPATGLGVALGRAARDTRQDGFAIRLERIVVFLMDDKKSCVAGKALPDNDKELREMLQTCARSGKPLRITYEVLPPSSPRTIMSDAASPLGRPAHSSGFSSAHPRSAAPSTGSAASPTVAASASPRSSGPSASATKSIPASSPKPTSSSVPKPATSTPPTATSNGSPPSATVTPPSRAPVTPAPIPQSPPPASTTTAPKAAPSSSGAATKHTANLPAKVPPASSTATQATSAPPTSSTAKPKSAAPKAATSRPATVTRTKSNDTTKSGEAHADPPRNAVASIRIQHPALLEDHQLTFSYSKTESELLHRFRDSCVSTVSKPTKGKPAEYFKVVVISGGEHHTITTDGDLREWIALSKESNRPLRVVLQPVSSRRSPSAGREPSPSGTAAHPKDPPSARPVSKQTPTALAPEKAASPPPPPLEEDLHTPTAAERNSTAAAVKLPEIKTPAKTVEPRTPSVRKESGGSTQSITSTEKLPDVRSSPSQLSPSNLESPRVQLSSLPNVQNATLPKANSAPPTHAVSTTSPPAPRSASVTTPRGVIPTRSTASTAQGSPERGSDPLSGKVELQQFAEIDSRPASQHPVLGSVGSSSITMSATEVRPPQSSPQGSPPRSARAEGRRRMLAKSEYFKVVAPSGLDPVLPARDVASCIAMNAAGDCLFQSFARWNEQESLILCRLSGSSLLQDLKRALCQEFEVDESVAPEIRIFLQELGGDVVEDSEIASDEALRSRLKLLTVSAAMLAVKCSSHPNPPTSESTKPHLKELVRELSVELTSRLGHEFRVSQLQALLTPCEGNTEQIPGSKKFFDHLKAMPEAILRVSDEEVDSFLHLCFKGLDSSVAREVAHACVMRMTVFNLGSPMESLRCFFARFHRSMKVAPHGSVVPVFFTMCETHNLEMPITAEEALSESKFCGAVMEKFATDPTSIMNVFSTSAMEQLFPRRNRELRTPEEQEVLRTVFQEELKHCFDEWSIQQLEACIQSEEIRREPAVQTLLSVIGALLAGSPMANYVQWLVDHFRGRLASVLFAKMKTFETADGLPMQTLVHSCWELMRPELELNFLAQKQGEVAALGLWAFFAVQLECLNRHTSFPALPPYNSIPRQTSVVRAATLPLATAIKRGSSAGSSRPAPSTGDVVKAKKNKVQYIYKYYCSDLRTPHLPVANEEAKSGSPKLPSSA